MTTIHSTKSQSLMLFSALPCATITAMPELTLPPDLALLAHIVDAQPPDVQALFQYGMTMLLIEDGKAQIVERRKIDHREWLTVRTVTGEVFEIVKPDVSEERLAQLRDMAREVLDDERAAGDR